MADVGLFAGLLLACSGLKPHGNAAEVAFVEEEPAHVLFNVRNGCSIAGV